MIERHVSQMTNVISMSRKRIVWHEFIFSASQAIRYFGLAVTIYYGGILIANCELDVKNLIMYVWNFS